MRVLKLTMQAKSVNKRGFVLVEAIVAITIIVVGLLGIFSLLSQSLSLNRVVGDRYVATYLASEGIEIVKNIIDTNIVNGRAFNAGITDGQFEAEYDDTSLSLSLDRPLAIDPDSGLYSYDGDQVTRFTRAINIELRGGGDEVKVNSVVRWISRGEADFEVDLEDRFFNWR